MAHQNPGAFSRPYVISWNLTYRCNLACEHCYLDAGGTPLVDTANFADRSELGTEECFNVIDEIAGFAPECVTILTGGEPLLRRDILEIVRRAAERGLWVVVGTNGVRIGPESAKASGAGCPFSAMIPAAEGNETQPRPASEPLPIRWTAAAETRLANIPEFVRPMARTGIERFARDRGAVEIDETILDAAREFFGM